AINVEVALALETMVAIPATMSAALGRGDPLDRRGAIPLPTQSAVGRPDLFEPIHELVRRQQVLAPLLGGDRHGSLLTTASAVHMLALACYPKRPRRYVRQAAQSSSPSISPTRRIVRSRSAGSCACGISAISSTSPVAASRCSWA